jgi:hypothetical protein
MNELVSLDIALCLPACDIQALIQGRMICVIHERFINPGRAFVLSPTTWTSSLPLKNYYCSSFLSTAQSTMIEHNSQSGILLQPQQTSLLTEQKQLTLPPRTSEAFTIKAWARCERCQMYSPESFDTLSQLTIWTKEALYQALGQRPHIFLAFLRVYILPQALDPQALDIDIQQQNRQFLPLRPSLKVSNSRPVLSDKTFTQRQKQLQNLEPSLNPELEELQTDLATLSLSNPKAKELQQEIEIFLGWNQKSIKNQSTKDSDWIKQISTLGNRSKEQDNGKSNYQAGTDFENIVRKSLEFLGFQVDYFHKGGAGGVDVFCSQPYPLVAECKAGKKIPNDTAVQLLNLGTLRLQSQELFKQSAKLIIGPGEPTKQLKQAAKIQNMAIINPETLEKLVELQNTYRNAIDLFKLKEHLKSGQSDEEIQKYINTIKEEINLRAQIIQIVKKYLENTGFSRASVDSLHAAYSFSFGTSNKITPEQMQEILVELSSPLTGYLGRIKGNNWTEDKFYYLRDLPTS